MELKECIEIRRSVRNFNNKEITDDMLTQIVEAAKFAPSWKNTQVTRYYAIKSPKIKEKIIAAMPEFNLLAVKTAPVIIISTVIKMRSGYNKDGSFDSPKGKGWQMYDCGCSNMLFLLKARELGIGSVIMGLYDEAKIAEAINLPENEEVVNVIPIGFYDEEPPMPPKKGADVILKLL